jgi:type I restriction enzyme S subunit
MRSDWPTRTVSELESQHVLLVQDGNHGVYRPRREEIVAEGTPHIRAADISDAGTVDFTNAQKINDAALARIHKGVGASGDALLTHKGTVGRVGRVPADAPHFVCSPQTTFWRSLDHERLDPAFLFAFLRSPLFSAQLRARMHETDMAPYVSLTAQRSLSVVMPPIADQRRVASVLRGLDDKVDSNRRLATLLEETVATMFRARFVRFIGEQDLVGTNLGPVPKGWTVSPIGDVVQVVGGSTPSTKEPRYWEGGSHCFATPKDLAETKSRVLLGTKRHITDEGVNQISSGMLPRRTVLLSSRAPIGYTAISKVEVAVNQGFIAIPPSRAIPSEFVLCWLHENMDRIKAHAGGTTFAEISKRAFRPILIVLPPASLLAEFEQVARPMFDLLAGQQTETQTLLKIRDGLLPKLISGEIRVPDTADADAVIGSMAEEVGAAS